MSEEKTFRAVIVGSGPSGFYAAESLLKRKEYSFTVDMLDRLPTPFGLVRGGVAPDHGKIKTVTKAYDRIAELPGFRFFGNVKVGRDVTVEDLRAQYDIILYAIGNETDRKLGIPGEDLEGSRTATEFVAWYNGHPDYRDRKFDLSCESVAVVGIGNVAMDVTRILAKDPDDLAPTDMADYAVEALRKSSIREIFVLGRRGAAQAAFTPKEIMEIGEDPAIDLVIRPEDVDLDPASKEFMEKEADINSKKNVSFLTEQAKKGEGTGKKKVRLMLCTSPVELTGKGGKLTSVRVEANELYKGEDGGIRPRGTGKFQDLPVGLILRSVGYFGVPTPGVAFDEKKGRVSNKDGRVTDPASGEALRGEYVVGWAKRGPSGLVGTNRADSVATVDLVMADILEGKVSGSGKSQEAALAMLKGKQAKLVTFEDWRVLDSLEVANGQAKGKSRLKFTTIESMLEALEGARQINRT